MTEIESIELRIGSELQFVNPVQQAQLKEWNKKMKAHSFHYSPPATPDTVGSPRSLEEG